jgi:protein phosphatase
MARTVQAGLVHVTGPGAAATAGWVTRHLRAGQLRPDTIAGVPTLARRAGDDWDLHLRRLVDGRLRDRTTLVVDWAGPADPDLVADLVAAHSAAVTTVDAATDVVVLPDGTDGRHVNGPFDIVGDVHGDFDQLVALLGRLGYDPDGHHPDGRILVFVGDLVDKGPDSVSVLRTVRRIWNNGRALVVRGNHEHTLGLALTRCLSHPDGPRAGLAGTAPADDHRRATRQLLDVGADDVELRQLARWLTRLPLWLDLDGGDLRVVHSAVHPKLGTGASRRAVETWALFGPPGPKDADGNRAGPDWVGGYGGRATVVRGHVTVARAHERNGVVSLDTGAGCGGVLSAHAWPERTFTTAPTAPVTAHGATATTSQTPGQRPRPVAA